MCVLEVKVQVKIYRPVILLVGKPDRKRRRWMDNIKMDLAEIRWRGVEWNGLAQAACVGC
jgi:hypothetical protein